MCVYVKIYTHILLHEFPKSKIPIKLRVFVQRKVSFTFSKNDISTCDSFSGLLVPSFLTS